MDHIANMLTTIRNGGSAGKESVAVPYSNMKQAIANKLFDAGYIDSYSRKKRTRGGDMLEVVIRYVDEKPRITNARRISKLSRRMYRRVKDIRPVRQGYGATFLSTPKGILTDQEAIKENVGGEALFEIW